MHGGEGGRKRLCVDCLTVGGNRADCACTAELGGWFKIRILNCVSL